MSDQNNQASRTPQMPSGPGAVSEEDTLAQSTPIRNLIGAALMGAIGILAMVLSLQMKDPDGRIVTAPGLLPFLVGATLLAMAAGLAYAGIRRGGPAELRAWLRGGSGRLGIGSEARRSLALMALVALYIEALDLAFFEWTVSLGQTRLLWGSFEAYSALFLAVVLRMFWRGPWPHCLAVGLVFATAIAAVFRYAFSIPVPGSG